MRYLYLGGRIAAMVAVIALSLTGATKKHQFSTHEKAFFADAQTVEFVRPGLTITIASASIAKDGTIAVTYNLTDPSGLPLDAAGITTPGVVAPSFVAAVLPANQDQYTAYTTRVQSGAALPSQVNAGADSGGTTTSSAAGTYTYTFKAKA